MAHVSFHNRFKHPVIIGNKTIAPGQSRPVESSDIPADLLPPDDAPAAPAMINTLETLLEANVKTVVDSLSQMSDNQLSDLLALENAGAARKGVLAGIENEQLNRLTKADAIADLTARISGMGREELAAELTAAGSQQHLVDVVKAAMDALPPDGEGGGQS